MAEFVEDVCRNYSEIRIGRNRRNNATYMLLELHDEKHKRTLYVELSHDGTYWNVNSGGIFKRSYTDKNDIAWPEPTVGSSANTNTTEVADSPAEAAEGEADFRGGNSSQSISYGGKGNEKVVGAQGVGVENSLQEDISAAEADVNTSPSKAQKEAGNYKKGHVRIDGFDVSIEQPKGSVRRGTDADGKQWEQVMNNTYGYLRGTEGVDGDHIDVFLSDNPSQGDVFVVDQVNRDGSFDEHKVMYGFADEESARQAYLANYKEGWQGLGAITRVTKDEFRKWVESSHRKTKPFAEYKGVKTQSPIPLLDAVRTLYSKGKEVASQLFGMKFFDVAKTPDFMKKYGLRGDKFTIRYGVIARHIGKDEEHSLPLEIWEQLPDALLNPFAITKYYVDDKKQIQKGYRLYTSLQLSNGSYVVVGVEVKNAGRDMEVNSINTIFGRSILSDVHDELIYTSEEMTPEQQSLLNGNNPHQYTTERESSADKGKDKSKSVQAGAKKSAEGADAKKVAVGRWFGRVQSDAGGCSAQGASEGDAQVYVRGCEVCVCLVGY